MPGLDYEVHPLTVGSEHYTKCSRKERKSGYWARDVRHNMQPPKDVWVWVEDTSSRECRYDKSLTDQKCEGCYSRGMGEFYSDEIRRKGT